MVNRWRRWPRFLASFGLIAVFVGQAVAQSAGPSLFKLNIAKSFDTSNSQEWNPGAVKLKGVRALDIVTFVHRVNQAYFHGTERLLTDRFDVEYQSESLPRSVGEGIIMDSVLRMLNLRIVQRAMDVEVVIIDKPRKLGPSIWASYEATSSISLGREGSPTVGHTTMDGFARHLEGYFLRPVIDRTKMVGQFRWEAALQKDMTEEALIDEVKGKLGLDLKYAREKVLMYVVEPIPED